MRSSRTRGRWQIRTSAGPWRRLKPIVMGAMSARLVVVDWNRLSEDERWQADIRAYTNRLLGAAVASGQYAGSEIRHATKEFLMFGVGEPSPQVAAVLQQAPSSVRIIWRQAPYTKAELTSEMRRIMSRFRGRFTSGGARNDASGIEFTTTDARMLGCSEPPIRRRFLDAAIQSRSNTGGPPVTH